MGKGQHTSAMAILKGDGDDLTVYVIGDGTICLYPRTMKGVRFIGRHFDADTVTSRTNPGITLDAVTSRLMTPQAIVDMAREEGLDVKHL